MAENKKILGLVFAIIIVVSGILAFNKSDSTPSESQSDVTSDKSASTETNVAVNKKPVVKSSVKTSTSVNPAPSDVVYVIPKTLRQLFASGQSLKCTFTDVSALSGVEGIIYLSGTKARADFSVTYNVTTRMHEVILGEKTYIWADTATTGTQSTLTSSASPTATPNTTGINADKNISYRCDQWNLDSSKFTLPPTVTFKAQ